MIRRLTAALVFTLTPGVVLAQAESSTGAFTTGPLQWSPVVAARDVGWDSNVYQTPSAPTSDFTATFTPGADLALDTSRVTLTGSGGLDLVYYEKLITERAVNRHVNGRVDVPLKAFVPFVAGAYRRATERQGLETDAPWRYEARDRSTGARLLLTARTSLQLTLRRQDVTFDPGQVLRGFDVGMNLNRRSDGVDAALRFSLTPLTTLVGSGTISNDKYLGRADKDQESARAGVSLEFAPDAIIRGRAGVGFHQLHSVDGVIPSYRGATFDVDLSYSLLGVTRFDGRYTRDTAVSVEAPYYLQTAYGIDVAQAFVGPTELIGRVSRQNADYPGIGDINVIPRLDYTNTYGGGFAIRTAKASRITFNYERSRRRSVLDRLTYERQRVFTSVVLGF